MPFLADLEQPPRSRVPGLVLGFLVALPLAGLFVGWIIPTVVRTVLGGARDLDARLRANDAYMRSLCETAMIPERDAALCGCVLAVEVPSLDCRAPFDEWALAQAQRSCEAPEAHAAALSYCTCVDTVSAAAGAADSDEERRAASQAFENCDRLDDALGLPALDDLRAPPSED